MGKSYTILCVRFIYILLILNCQVKNISKTLNEPKKLGITLKSTIQASIDQCELQLNGIEVN